VVVLVAGLAVLATGILMIVLPGPAFIVIPLGLAILATEFLWARRLLQRMKRTLEKTGVSTEKAPAPIRRLLARLGLDNTDSDGAPPPDPPRP
jgi:uncharacterized protein (TIGR02611 family)